jgi:hypothetical protein
MTVLRAVAFCLLAGGLVAGPVLAQGSLNPTSAPAPSMKSLQEIWDRLGTLEIANAAQRSEIQSLQQQNSVVLSALGVNPPWQTSTVNSNSPIGTLPSLAFAPNGQPAIAFSSSYGGITSRLYYSV